AGGQSAKLIARWNGSAWQSFGTPLQGWEVSALVVYCDSELIVSGDFQGAGVYENAIWRDCDVPPPSCPGQPCLSDIDGSGGVNLMDLQILINGWGTCGAVCPGDIDHNGVVT